MHGEYRHCLVFSRDKLHRVLGSRDARFPESIRIDSTIPSAMKKLALRQDPDPDPEGTKIYPREPIVVAREAGMVV
jgi:hypothetical protein